MIRALDNVVGLLRISERGSLSRHSARPALVASVIPPCVFRVSLINQREREREKTSPLPYLQKALSSFGAWARSLKKSKYYHFYGNFTFTSAVHVFLSSSQSKSKRTAKASRQKNPIRFNISRQIAARWLLMRFSHTLNREPRWLNTSRPFTTTHEGSFVSFDNVFASDSRLNNFSIPIG